MTSSNASPLTTFAKSRQVPPPKTTFVMAFNDGTRISSKRFNIVFPMVRYKRKEKIKSGEGREKLHK